eukprot:1161290-Pelagomonas_calceolata.AAC.1
MEECSWLSEVVLKCAADLVRAVGKVDNPDASRSFARAGAVQAAQHLDGLAACTQVVHTGWWRIFACGKQDKGPVQAATHLGEGPALGSKGHG